MNRYWRSFIALCALAVAGCASNATMAVHAGDAVGDEASQVLVMLPSVPPHLHATTDYGGHYSATSGSTTRLRVAQQLAHEYGLELVSDWPMPALGLDCFVMRTAPGKSVTQVTQALAHDARVESAEPMQLFHVLAKRDPLYPLQPTASQWHLAELHATTTGKGITIAELDSGVDTSNPDLAGQVTQTQNFVDNGPYRAELHGTEVAGVMVAIEGNGLGIAGVAPDARLLALRACWQETTNAAAMCSSFTLAKALQYALENHAQVVNLSLAGPYDRLLERLLEIALSRNVTVVSAIDGAAADGGFPASLPGVLAIADEGTTSAAIAGAMHAPGQDVPTTLPGRRWDFVTGSSFSAAEVSGLVALIRQLSPDIPAGQLRDVLATRTALGLVAMRPTMIDACAAVARVRGNCTCDCATAHASIGGLRQ